jgi:hypothetical protein
VSAPDPYPIVPPAGGPAAEEPSADARVFARAMRDLFIALQAEGFTERQSILLVGQAIAASQGQGE